MLPQIQVNNNKYRRARPRPINSLDNPSTTGQLVNPNGSYVANPTPTTAYAGGQGAFGATLPQVSVNAGINPMTSLLSNRNGFMQNIVAPAFQATTNALGLTSTPKPPTPIIPASMFSSQGAAQSGTPPGALSVSAALSPQNAMNQYRQGEQGNVFDINNPMLNAVIGRLANGEAADLTTQDQAALEKFLTTEMGMPEGTNIGGGGGGGNSDFMNTKFMQENVANGVGFYDQLRWDPQRKKYVQIGKLMREGKLSPKGKWNPRGHKKKGGGGRGGPTPPGAPAGEVTQGFTGSYGVVSFNTATG